MRVFSIILLFSISNCPCNASLPADTIKGSYHLQEVVVESKKIDALQSDDHGDGITINNSQLSKSLRVFGEADALSFVRLLPGIQIGNDYASGLSVQGCDYSQTLIDMAGAPVFYPYHALGIFSTCNTAHFKNTRIEKSIHFPDFPDRLGGGIWLSPQDELPGQMAGEFNLGLLATSAHTAIPIGKSCGLWLSGRLSYVNLLYSHFLQQKGEGHRTRYDFHDLNTTFLWKPSKQDDISFNIYRNGDGLNDYGSAFFLNAKSKWYNTTSSCIWEHHGKIKHRHTLWASNYNNRTIFSITSFYSILSSDITMAGYKDTYTLPLAKGNQLRWGMELEAGFFHAQGIEIDSIHNKPAMEKSLKETVYADYILRCSPKANLSIGARATAYQIHRFHRYNIDPMLTLEVTPTAQSTYSVHAGIYHQYIHQVGFSEIGMPTNYWIPADERIPVQRAIALSASWKKKFWHNQYELDVDIYGKRLDGQTEFRGVLLDILSSEYNEYHHIDQGKGYNWGVDLMLRRNYGRWNGWLSYSLGFAKRIFDIDEEWTNSVNEPLHQLSLFTRYRLSDYFSIAGTFTYASGRPYTKGTSLYIVAENVINSYGKRNGARLPDYHRLDLSVTWHINPHRESKIKQELNLSLLNAYYHKNIISMYYTYNYKKSILYQRKRYSFYNMLPSLSYTLKF